MSDVDRVVGYGEDVRKRQTSTKEAVVESFEEIAITIGGTALLLFFLFVLVVLASMLWAYSVKVNSRLKALDSDPRVLAFGQSVPGKMVNSGLQAFYPLIDEPSDPLIKAALQLPILRRAYAEGAITGEELSAKSADVVSKAIYLTDGIPNVDFKLWEATQSTAKAMWSPPTSADEDPTEQVAA